MLWVALGPSTPTLGDRSTGAASVEELPTFLGTTVAGELVAGILDGELIVVGELFPAVDLAHGEDDDVLLPVNVDDPRVAVGLTGVIDEAGRISVHGGVHHLRVIDPEHVATDALAVIILLSLVSLDGADDIASIFNHHLTCINVSFTKKTPAMDGRPVDTNCLLRSLF